MSVSNSRMYGLNPDKTFVHDLRKRIMANDGFCPCKLEKTKDTKCPCLLFRNANGCLCGLFVKLLEDELK